MIAPTTSATPSITIPTATSSAATDINTVMPSPQGQSVTALHQALQAARLKNYNFKKITLEDTDLTDDIAKILRRHKVLNEEAYRHNKAVLSDDGNTLVLTLDGRTTLSNYFGGKGAISRFYAKTLGAIPRAFGSANTLIGSRRYKELYNQDQTIDPDGEKGESLSELHKGLYSNHYHSVVVFEKDKVSGKFTKYPKALAITDSYMMLIRSNIKTIKLDAKEEEIKALEESFKKYYSLDKVLPWFSSDENFDFNEMRHKIIEGLYQAQGFDLLTVPSQIDPSPNSNTNDLNYKRIEWHDVKQKNSGDWKAIGDPALVTDTVLSNPKEKEKYLKTLQQQNRSITLVRPISKAAEALAKEIAILEGLSQMSSGSQSRATEQDLELMKQAAKVNQTQL